MKLFSSISKQGFKRASYFMLFIAAIMSYIEITRPHFKSSDDVIKLDGHFKGYEFTEYGRGGTSHLFWLKEYKNAFKISADFWSSRIFNKEAFYKLQYGDLVKIAIHKREHNYFEKSGNYILVYAIQSSMFDILRIEDAIKVYNSNSILYASILFCLFGIICFYFGYRK
jgi:hypothetical protein